MYIKSILKLVLLKKAVVIICIDLHLSGIKKVDGSNEFLVLSVVTYN